jgi:integrase
LRHAAKKKDIPYNVAEFIDRPKYKPGNTMIWAAEQTSFFLERVKKHPQYIAFLLLLTYGMRRGEVLGIRWCDIDFENDNIYVRQQVSRINGAIKVGELKTESSFRVIPISPDIRAALLEHAKKNNVEIPPFEPYFKMSLDGTIVRSKVGTPVEPRNLQRCFQNLAAKAGCLA